MNTRTVSLVLTAAASLGALIGLLLTVPDGPRYLTVRTPAVVEYTPTATPRPDQPSPDFGYLEGEERREGVTYLVFNRATLLTGARATAEADRYGQQRLGYFVVDENPRVRRFALAEGARLSGSQLLTGQPQPTEVTLDRLLNYLDRHADERPLPVWLRYDAAGRIVAVEEQYLPGYSA
ncbi:hypothetical protein TH66_12460 [Carbonactinospora thermoautotrophica]|uniref:Uncharacterized protein n=1 Tax=Carbonactinospora thermoautotrophica TaxID=1469144 RepID=A0A132NGE9_9ACTN|nr:hypothetical protein [Carbonactinospora thermoautotrophica]KWX02546.1 hypothetical protein LI90_3589 [Carbonactinospora thermoautotrophica]KWX03641.1 hypothetical protein TH66_12460 [Carbonactinospora thermoautotrophica]KWX09178.1 hypothetical protein TR74_11195 [Carbonactinospora thermoautotrophica]